MLPFFYLTWSYFVPHLTFLKSMHSLLLRSLFPFLLFTSFISINFELCLCQPYSICKEAISCGGIGDISYPFWGVNRPNFCGQPGFELRCLDDVPVINMSNISYRILEMNSSSPRTIKVARQDYWKTLCPSSFANTSINFSLFNYSSGLTNVTFYYGCDVDVPRVYYSSQVCNVNNGSDQVDTGLCKVNVTVPVFSTAAIGIEVNPTTLQDAIDGGFKLEIKIDNDQCNSCEGSGGRCGHNTTTGGFTCHCQDQASATICNSTSTEPSGSLSPSWKIGISAGVSGTIVAVICIICISRKRKLMCFSKKDKTDDFDVGAFIRNYGSLTPKRYSYSDVKKMTISFRDKIGKGGYGTVYRGKLPDGCLVAVKVLSDSKGNGEEFINEVASIGRTSHVNVVTLFGFCYERDKRALIYEFMPNGSLDNFIHKQGSDIDNCRLGWKTLSEIAVGVARGLEYLHRGCNTRILHLDIKPQNILLDKDFCPKIADFGLAKLCKAKESVVSMLGTRGTAGYIAPEVFSRSFGGVSHKSDVYSYGMLVLEMVGARKNLDSGVSHTSEMFPHYIYKDLELENNANVFGASSEEENEIARKMVLISMWCIQTIPSDRPSMSKVVEMLEGPIQSLQLAPKPSLFSHRTAAENSMSTNQQSDETN
ncbi:LEAF RUST 10 DISEASE-RESISTANCE LOCUS RECEPTOR-LIKE PROTEIN KINASE-like 2.4 isoform X2 [Malus sylvestris]|uniref:LEAF RUST 10 DISEASE-RESISTANCE LOCUS RECEPTOR-LIKE PROTEIN KINASE-like 2.4 isoform X2 n=1 Tax=Malus sylvestris TaxID=3752 RepID=UPI0021ACEFD9|nr:LEAF RUST 10 DISEASE-RESISTANCE LOCUS RECEPTOR-LIKE PROTEIN KINASE-like 2.4 isoform X2 [Malus sylvestris]